MSGGFGRSGSAWGGEAGLGGGDGRDADAALPALIGPVGSLAGPEGGLGSLPSLTDAVHQHAVGLCDRALGPSGSASVPVAPRSARPSPPPSPGLWESRGFN